MKTKPEEIVLTKAWLGLGNIPIHNFSITGYTVYSTRK